MVIKENKKDVVVNNDAYKERFQFIVYSNDNIICQRYFRINGFNSDAIGSVDLFHTLEECVQMIKDDLNHKSFVYQTLINDEPVKMTGFLEDPATISDLCNLTSSLVSGNVVLSDGREVEKSYLYYNSTSDEVYGDTEKLNPWDVTFKFEFRVDDRAVYERIWDGTVYPKHIRNSVDLSNTGSNANPSSIQLNSIDGVLQYVKIGRPNLVYLIIRNIVKVMSGGHEDPEKYVNTISFDNCALKFDNETDIEVPLVDFRENDKVKECGTTQGHPVTRTGQVEYSYYNYDNKFFESWKRATYEKGVKYRQWLTRCEKFSDMGGLFPNEWNHIEKHL